MSIEKTDITGVRNAAADAEHHATVARQFAASDKGSTVFEAAERHSRRVRLLKFSLPVIALVGAAVFSWFTFFSASAFQTTLLWMVLESGWQACDDESQARRLYQG